MLFKDDVNEAVRVTICHTKERFMKFGNTTIVLYENVPNKQKKGFQISLDMQVIDYQEAIELCLPSVQTNQSQT